ncbi:MAG: Formate-dependent phosphoribosyl glycinamide formyl transferase [Cyanobacteriota bacterium]|jgi:phosphoribosylglycinamide formyltransferase 2
MSSTLLPATLLLLGSGELGKELAIAGQRLGCRVVAVDSYAGAPAMQVADEAVVIPMTDAAVLKQLVRAHQPALVIPEIEALAVDALAALEAEGITVIPTAQATATTMNRDRIRNLAAGELGLRTARYGYARSATELAEAAAPLGWPVVVKPVMSSSGKGQSVAKNSAELAQAWQAAAAGARGSASLVIVEEFLRFEQEITLLTVRQQQGPTLFCPPIGHLQERGDYQCSWQPAQLQPAQLLEAQRMARLVTDALGGVGIFGVEFFISAGEVIFSELSPRPHDTGLVTLAGQNLNQFELHLRAVLGLPIGAINSNGPAASRVILAGAQQTGAPVSYSGVATALAQPESQVLLFGKPEAWPQRRMGVALARGVDLAEARRRADAAAAAVEVLVG